jgi:hypothetical protein
MTMGCKICSGPVRSFGRAKLLNTYMVDYFRCQDCGFVQPEEVYWLSEAYADAITASDIGLIGRNIAAARSTQLIIRAFFDSGSKFIDYGGGYGILVRLMRDAGFDFYREDKFCPNLFARGFDADLGASSTSPFELATAFEVFEHFVRPVEDVAQILGYAKSILFSTTLLPDPTPKLGDWWYYGLEHGQHIALYSLESLKALADRFRLRLYSDGQSLHLLTDKRLSARQFKLIARYSYILSMANDLLTPRRSLLAGDYLQLTGRPLQ